VPEPWSLLVPDLINMKNGRASEKDMNHKSNLPNNFTCKPTFLSLDVDLRTKFQTVMTDYQIHVVSKEHFNGIIFHGPEAEKKIHLYLHDGHYDVITSMPAFLNRSYYCHHCQKGYDHKEEHKCNNICTSCHKIHDLVEKDWIYCGDCHRYFRGPECHNLHKKTTPKGKSTCNSYYKCKDCEQTINVKMHKKNHVCGEVYCTTCKDYFDKDHKCYMKPVDVEEKCTTAVDDMDDEGDEDGQVYIFFYFECTQDALIECDEGHRLNTDTGKCNNCGKSPCGSYEHEPNL
jgi:hypothetical protein